MDLVDILKDQRIEDWFNRLEWYIINKLYNTLPGHFQSRDYTCRDRVGGLLSDGQSFKFRSSQPTYGDLQSNPCCVISGGYGYKTNVGWGIKSKRQRILLA